MATLTVVERLAHAEQLFRTGRLDEMEALCRSILAVASATADAHRFLGLAAHARGCFPEALEQLQRALALAPGEAVAHDNLGLVLAALGRHAEAETAARQALALQPALAGAHHNLGRALHAQGRLAEAETALRQTLALSPSAERWNDLAAVLNQLGKLPETALALERALQLRPDFTLARENLLRLRAVASTASFNGPQENNRGVTLLAQKRHAEAEIAFRQALALQPDLPPEVLYNLAKALSGQQQFAEAEALYLRVLSQRPNWAECNSSLAHLYFCQRRLGDAEDAYRQALRVRPDHVAALNGLAADVLNNQGRIEEARAVYRQALAYRPDDAACHSDMLLNEQYRPGVSLAALAEAHAGWERQHAAPLRSQQTPFRQPREPERPLRVGFVSGDFCYHPVGFFLAPVLERLDRSQWFTACYANRRTDDDMTQRLARSAHLWRQVDDQNDAALAELIRADAIDLLVDLSGHTGYNRLLTFARRPAAVQLTWMGYVGTTGLEAMDYLIADRFHIPPGWEAHFREKVLRLPDGYVCYEPPPYAPAVGPLPALAAGQVTFGCFHNTAKITPPAVAAWADVLRQVPDARLVVKCHWLGDASLRQHLTAQFAAQGIPAERLELLGHTTHIRHLEQFHRIDLALDSFPYSGGLTTCEACWMGVPVVTWPGETFASRHSLSHLSNIGLTETITRDLMDYVATAVRLGRDLPRLAILRGSLRQRMAKAPLSDADRFADQFATALRQTWREYCAASA